jgi:hypothetical protein
MANVDGKPTPALFNADLSSSFDGTSAAITLAVNSVGTVRDMRKSVDQRCPWCRRGRVVMSMAALKIIFLAAKAPISDQTVEALRSGGVKGDLAWNGDDDPEAESLLRTNMGEAYNKDLSAAENYRRYFESTAVFASN